MRAINKAFTSVSSTEEGFALFEDLLSAVEQRDVSASNVARLKLATACIDSLEDAGQLPGLMDELTIVFDEALANPVSMRALVVNVRNTVSGPAQARS